MDQVRGRRAMKLKQLFENLKTPSNDVIKEVHRIAVEGWSKIIEHISKLDDIDGNEYSVKLNPKIELTYWHNARDEYMILINDTFNEELNRYFIKVKNSKCNGFMATNRGFDRIHDEQRGFLATMIDDEALSAEIKNKEGQWVKLDTSKLNESSASHKDLPHREVFFRAMYEIYKACDWYTGKHNLRPGKGPYYYNKRTGEFVLSIQSVKNFKAVGGQSYMSVKADGTVTDVLNTEEYIDDLFLSNLIDDPEFKSDLHSGSDWVEFDESAFAPWKFSLEREENLEYLERRYS
jgi:hypothetical protein